MRRPRTTRSGSIGSTRLKSNDSRAGDEADAPDLFAEPVAGLSIHLGARTVESLLRVLLDQTADALFELAPIRTLGSQVRSGASAPHTPAAVIESQVLRFIFIV